MIKSIRGVSYHIDIHGEGAPLLLLHGFTGSLNDWDEMLPLLQGYTLIRIDLIGHGKTEAPENDARYTMQEVCKDLARLLDELELPKISLAGYSMGGRTALCFAAAYPERVERLILESASPGLKTAKEREARRESDVLLAERILSEGVASFIGHWEKQPLFASQEKLSEEKKAFIRAQRLANRPEGLSNSLKGMGTGSQPNLWDELGKSELQVLIMAGELDSKFCKIGKDMNERFKYSQYIEVKEAGHAIHVEQPRLFGTIVNGFLKQ
ncbi:2-succinyl-6-hydroxy-2,4-cyclohexadiene-1-carboxylate synthase [Bacillus sp. FJAT-42376]|uniref:2-succinyl-6-hydroxy-2, 4-cyclohexadiene-1-carboxylate synthase n=1 Tax=Bacillus sp. FJAT-42376 TaxID=2014076 RepID=UPI000F4FF16A|nr:2-succinyl-6-hydroxy-2,4-cyclohexadiene-1-carboxylate synthase [Bacillus sp. FJAT-42376]AZB44103.1 2-succinyl-6-hydroxy-2,4-cyclohexadiene-1-carboxylate synthase [Bacillus sp. FJAT-42376]